jgi:hypothetical protein
MGFCHVSHIGTMFDMLSLNSGYIEKMTTVAASASGLHVVTDLTSVCTCKETPHQDICEMKRPSNKIKRASNFFL